MNRPIGSCWFRVSWSKAFFGPVTKAKPEGTSSSHELSIKFGADSTGLHGRQTQFGSARDAINATSIIEASLAEKDHFGSAPYERWYIDLTGPHPMSDRGSVYILTCLDSFTKWAEAFPLRNKEAETVAKVLVQQVFCRFGTPVLILSD